MPEVNYNPMEKALHHRNYEAMRKLDDIEANKRWAERETLPFPVYKTCHGIKNDVGWRNFLRNLLKESKLLVNNLKP